MGLLILICLTYQHEAGASMSDHCKTEIVELHQFFVAWYKGERQQDAVERFNQVMARDFRIVMPDARVIARDPLIKVMTESYGKYRGKTFEIQIRNVSVIPVGTGMLLATYEEWQDSGDGMKGRLSSALFRVQAHAPNGLEWVHVHETWLPDAS